MILNVPVLANKVLAKVAGIMAIRLQLLLQELDRLEPDQGPEPER